MKAKSENIKVLITIACFFLFISFSYPADNKQIPNKVYIAIELNQVLCGYSEIILSDSIINGKKIKVLKQSTFASFFALGKDLTTHQKFTYHIDPTTGNFIYHDSYIQQGDTELGGVAYVEGDTIRFKSLESGEEKKTFLPENTILPNTQFFPHLKDDFGVRELEIKTYTVYDVRTGEVTEIGYTKTGEEELELTGEIYDAVILNEPDPSTGLESRLWIDKNSGMRLKTESPSRISMYLTDCSVQNRIKTGSWDDVLFVKTNKSIKDIREISYMKVKCSLGPIPAPDDDDVNVPGQKFTGTLDGNKLEGIFEIAHKKYDGKNASIFPLDTNQYENLSPYLKAEEMIESDDPALVAKATEITEGSEDLWEATCRISHWVVENIDGSILDGSALETFDRKSGLCGAQSKLMAALCRAVGIPARVVWGCMYTREQGGSFGHHGWNEIFMGEAGWIPIDVTIHETDYVDSGHIRLGVLHTRQTIINFGEMEILKYMEH